jgi:flagella basal body P-ring formation protein FlgA
MGKLSASFGYPIIVAAVALCAAGRFVTADGAEMQVPVPSVTIYPGQVIDSSMLVDADVETAAALPPSTVTSTDELIGKVARQTLLPHHPVVQSAVRETWLIKQGQAASIVFQSGALTITSAGLALQSGSPGDMVSVRNVDSGRIVKGTIGADGSVHVGDP